MSDPRLFVALELPRAVRANLERLQADLQAALPHGSVRWVDPWGSHLTLQFLGRVGQERLPAARDSLRAAAERGMTHHLRLEGLGCFPRPQRPRVVWVGVSGETTRLLALQREIEEALAGLGFEPEQRAFHPHVTVGRVRQPSPALTHLLCNPPGAHLGHLHAGEVHLVESHPSPRGARYESLASCPLIGGS